MPVLRRVFDAVLRAVERRLNPPYIRFICLTVLVVFLMAMAVTFATGTRGRSKFGPALGADFGAFYIAGKIFNTHSHEQIYDAELHATLYHEAFPEVPQDSQLPYANAPFFILPFTLLARLPYAWAYLAWLLISICLYVSGVLLVWRSLEVTPKDALLTTLLVSVTFMPFLTECLAGGQTSAVGVFFLALAISTEHRSRILSGIALALCSYKPTLLLLALPMLLISGRLLTLLAFVIGNLALALVSFLTVGWEGCVRYVRMLFFFANASTSASSGLHSWKYVDINSFLRLLLGTHATFRWVLVGLVFLIMLPLLCKFWFTRGKQAKAVWAIALIWTPVLNIYMGIYDASIVAIGALLAVGAVLTNTNRTLPKSFKLMLALLYVTPWFTQAFALLIHIQVLTIVIALFGLYQLTLLSQKPSLLE